MGIQMNIKRTLGGLAGLGLLIGCLNTTDMESSGTPSALRGDDSADGIGRADKVGEKEFVCHIPPGNAANAHTLHIGYPAVNTHLAHGDVLGRCPEAGATISRKPCSGKAADDSLGHGTRIPKDNNSDGFKVTLCHIPPDTAAAANTLSVSPAAVKAHLAHGDVLGSCENDSGSLSYVEQEDCADGPGESGSGDSSGPGETGSGETGSGSGETGSGSGTDTTTIDIPVDTGT